MRQFASGGALGELVEPIDGRVVGDQPLEGVAHFGGGLCAFEPDPRFWSGTREGPTSPAR